MPQNTPTLTKTFKTLHLSIESKSRERSRGQEWVEQIYGWSHPPFCVKFFTLQICTQVHSFDPTNDVKQNVVQVILTLQLTIYLGFCNLYE